MVPRETMIFAAECVALSLSVVSFLIFAVLAFFWARVHGGASPLQARIELGAAAKLAEALAKLVEALAKAGPLTSALFASIVFLVIASYVALHAPETKPPPANRPTPTPAQLLR